MSSVHAESQQGRLLPEEEAHGILPQMNRDAPAWSSCHVWAGVDDHGQSRQGLACLYMVLGQGGMFQQPMGMYAQGQMGFQGKGSYSPMGGFRPKGPGFRGRMAKLKSMCKPAC